MTPVALVTGASSGLGAEFARQLSAKGYRLVLAARRKDRLDALVAELGHARAIAIDLSESGAAGRLMADLDAADETVSLLVNNAGYGLVGRFAELDAGRQRAMIDLNCGALVELAHAVLPAMRARRKGAILMSPPPAHFSRARGSRSISRPRRSSCRSARHSTKSSGPTESA